MLDSVGTVALRELKYSPTCNFPRERQASETLGNACRWHAWQIAQTLVYSEKQRAKRATSWQWLHVSSAVYHPRDRFPWEMTCESVRHGGKEKEKKKRTEAEREGKPRRRNWRPCSWHAPAHTSSSSFLVDCSTVFSSLSQTLHLG